MSERLPMFPLTNALVPHMLLPLMLFEPRYLTMHDDCVAGSGEFGVVLIERGGEVGGGDVRTDVGAVARILESSDLEDGNKLVLAAGTQRLRVVEWLEDNPYPQAIIERQPDLVPVEDLSDQLDAMSTKLRCLFGLMAEVGLDVGTFEAEFADDPVVATYQGITLAPVGPFDRQRLLDIDPAAERLSTLLEMLDEQVELYRNRLSVG